MQCSNRRYEAIRPLEIWRAIERREIIAEGTEAAEKIVCFLYRLVLKRQVQFLYRLYPYRTRNVGYGLLPLTCENDGMMKPRAGLEEMVPPVVMLTIHEVHGRYYF